MVKCEFLAAVFVRLTKCPVCVSSSFVVGVSISVAAVEGKGRAASIKEMIEKWLECDLADYTVTCVSTGCKMCRRDTVLVGNYIS